MIVLGLTGSIAAGKSTASAVFRAAGAAVFDADAAVHALYRGAAAPLVEAAFPGTVIGGVVDRARLAAALGGDAAALQRLEAIVHPLVRAEETRFRDRAAAKGTAVAVLDVPLFFETGWDRRADAVVVVTVPPGLQRARVLARPGMTEARFRLLLSRQLPAADKARRAHFLVDSSRPLAASAAAVRDILRAIAPVAAARGPRQ